MTEESSLWAGVKETVKTIVYALLIAGAFRTVLFQPFWIPSGSMKDTLLVGDFLFVNKMAYGYSYASCPVIKIGAIGLDIDAEDFCGFFKGKGRLFGSEPERGDIVVFRHPVTGEDYIKRLIGLPGDRIQMQNGVLYINETAVVVTDDGQFLEPTGPQGPQQRQPMCAELSADGQCVKYRAIETLPNGVSHDILNVGDGPVDNTPVYTVEPGTYFFMGDNRDNSIDSRYAQTGYPAGVGMVPAENLIGRADRVIFSSGGRSMLSVWDWRADRFFHKLD